MIFSDATWGLYKDGISAGRHQKNKRTKEEEEEEQ